MTVIREATETDLPAILAIYNHAIEYTTAVWTIIPATLDDRRQWFQNRATAGFPILVAENQGHICGFASFGPFRAFQGFAQTVEHSVYVDAEHRGQGVARLLMQALIEKARALKIHVMVGGVEASNTASANLHLSLGFKDTGTLKEVGRKFDKWLDLAFFTLNLD